MEPIARTQVIENAPNAPPALVPQLSVPSIPDLSLVRPIGRGAYGEVWLARTVAGGYRAVKVVYRRSFEDNKPFEREFRGLVKFEPISRLHPGVVDILHIGRNEEAGYFYYVMELADDVSGAQPFCPETYQARTLHTELSTRGRLNAQECLAVGVALATALEHLHSHGLTHRDIKPSNIVYVDGVPKLADVGLVAELAGTQSVGGTIGFAPPEGPGTIRADIYALGKLLYEAAFGRDRGEFPELPTELRSWRDCESLLELNAILLKACEQDPHKRYRDAHALLRDLALLQEGRSVRRQHSRDRAKRVFAVAAVVCGLAALVGAGAWAAVQRLARASTAVVVNQQVTSGRQLLDEGDPGGALLWFTEVLQHTRPNSASARAARIRCASVLDHCPTLQQVFLHSAPVTAVAFSPDERHVLTASEDKTARIWNAATGAPLTPPLNHAGPVLSAAFSPSGDRVVTAGRDGLVRLWNSQTGEPVLQPMKHPYPVWQAIFDSTGNRLYTASSAEPVSGIGGVLTVWNTQTAERIASTDLPGVRSVMPTRDGSRLLTASSDGSACLFNAETLAPEGTPFHSDRPLRMAAFNPSENLIAVAGYDGTARLWSVLAAQPGPGPLRHTGVVLWAAFNPDGTQLLTTSSDQTIRIWDIAGGREAPIWAWKTSYSVGQACWSGDGRRVLLAHADNIARLWLMPRPDTAVTRLQHGGAVLHAEFSADGHRVLTCGSAAGQPGYARVWDAATGQPIDGLLMHEAPVIFSAFSPDGTRVLTVSPDRQARIWAVETGRALTDPLVHVAQVWHGAFSPDGLRVVTASGENGRGDARIWNVATGQLLAEPLRHDSEVMWVAFSPDGHRVVSAGGSPAGPGKCRVWDASTAEPLSPWLEHSAQVWHVCFSPDGATVATAGLDQTAQVWDYRSGKALLVLRHSGPIRCVRFSADGSRIVTASLDKTARVWDTRSGNPVGAVLNHAGPVTDATFSPDGRWVLTCSADGSARVWEASTGTMVTPSLVHNGVVHSAAFGPDNVRFVTAAADGTARIYRLNDEVGPATELVLTAQNISGRRVRSSTDLAPLSQTEAREAATAAVRRGPR